MENVITSKNFHTIDTKSPGLIFLAILAVVTVVLIIYAVIKIASTRKKACTLAPPVPVNVRAGYINDGSFLVAWNYIPNADNYTVYVGKTSTFDKSQAIKTVSTDKSRIEISQLALNQTYYIYVVATNSCGDSNPSPTITFTYT